MLPEIRPTKVGQWSEPALRVLRERYLLRKDGEVIETPEEMCWRGAGSIAAGEGRDGRSGGGVRGGARGLFGTKGGGYFLPNPPTPMEGGNGDRLEEPDSYQLPPRGP